MALPLHSSCHTFVPEQALRCVVSPKFGTSYEGKEFLSP